MHRAAYSTNIRNLQIDRMKKAHYDIVQLVIKLWIMRIVIPHAYSARLWPQYHSAPHPPHQSYHEALDRVPKRDRNVN